jgi:hypothetical protein
MRHGMLRLWQILRFVVFLFFLFQSGVVVLIVEVWCGFAHESSSRTTWYSLSSSCREWLFEIFDDHSFNNNPLMLVNSEDDPDSVTCATRFQMKLMRKYGEPLPRLFIGSFDEAINKAKRDFKFLLVYLHSDIHENTPRFCRSLITISLSCFTSFCFFFESHWKIFLCMFWNECLVSRKVLCTERITSFIDEHFIVWAGDVQTAEGFKVSSLTHFWTKRRSFHFSNITFFVSDFWFLTSYCYVSHRSVIFSLHPHIPSLLFVHIFMQHRTSKHICYNVVIIFTSLVIQALLFLKKLKVITFWKNSNHSFFSTKNLKWKLSMSYTSWSICW